MRVALLCDNEPFLIPETVQSIVDRASCHTFFLISVPGHGSARSFKVNASRYLTLYGLPGFLVKGFLFVLFKLTAKLNLPTRVPHSLMQVASRRGLQHFVLEDPNSLESREILRSMDLDVAVSLACPKILSRETRRIPRQGFFNVHSAMLPANRGMLPSFWTLYHRNTPAGVTIHRMNSRLDDGPILIQKELDLDLEVTSLHRLLSVSKGLAADLVVEGLSIIDSGDYELLPNGPEGATINSFPGKEDVREFRRRGGRIW